MLGAFATLQRANMLHRDSQVVSLPSGQANFEDSRPVGAFHLFTLKSSDHATTHHLTQAPSSNALTI